MEIVDMHEWRIEDIVKCKKDLWDKEKCAFKKGKTYYVFDSYLCPDIYVGLIKDEEGVIWGIPHKNFKEHFEIK